MLDPTTPPITATKERRTKRKDRMILAALLGIVLVSILFWAIIRDDVQLAEPLDGPSNTEHVVPKTFP